MKTTTLINYNNKLACNTFIHIDLAPSTPVTESKLPVTVIIQEEVLAGEGSALDMLDEKQSKPMNFTAELVDFARCDIMELSSINTYLSHGISREEFIKQHKGSPNMAVYIYRKTSRV